MIDERTRIPLPARCPHPLVLPPDVPCELEPGHSPPHQNGLLRWHEPPLILVGGLEPDTVTETDHWQHGDVRFSWEEPRL